MNKEDCIFCKIANGKMSTRTLYEDDLIRVILEIAPTSLGHSLILLKEHKENFYELSEEEAQRVILVAKKMANHLRASLCCDGLNLLQNNGVEAGQTIHHFHMHLIPRYHGAPEVISRIVGSATDSELDALHEKLTKETHSERKE
ncbi:MAG: HIT domain-containing protein [Lachnospiraceae bacterium]|jgi:histidine triad (HIT) family protein|nr:HIT domain-containing protein [Lachnospiraceae bacterium]